MDGTGLALLAGIVAEPADNTRRLVFADYLDDADVTLECLKCKRPADAKNWVTGHIPGFTFGDYWQPCTACGGSTRVPYPARHERAEFIRGQVELVKFGPPHKRVGYGGAGTTVTWSGGPNYLVFTGDSDEANTGDRVDMKQYVGMDKSREYLGLVVTRKTDRGSDGIEYVVKQDDQSGPWGGTALRNRTNALFTKHGKEWFGDCWALVGAGTDGDDDCEIRFNRLDHGRLFVSRGFVSAARVSADRWFELAAEGLYWHPSQWVVCPGCAGKWNHQYYPDTGCPECVTGNAPRPCPQTAQPVTKVVLTTRPTVFYDEYSYGRADEIGLVGSSYRVPTDEFTRRVGDRDVIKMLLEEEFQGVEFDLPAHGDVTI